MRDRHVSAAELRARLGADPDAPWQIAERRFDAQRLGAAESIFAVGNGYLGVRGAPEEGYPARDASVVLNGFHETWPIVYPEDAYGLARTGQTIVNATDGSVIRLYVDDEPFDLTTARIIRFERALDMRAGVLVREVEFERARGTRVHVRSRRLASLAERHLVAFDYEVSADGARITVCSELVTHAPEETADDPRRGRGFADKPLVALAAHADGDRAVLELATRNSGLNLACAMAHSTDATDITATADGDHARIVVEAQDSLRLSKFVAYHWAAQAPEGDLLARAERTLDRAVAAGYRTVEADHGRVVEAFWERSDVQIDGAPEVQQAVRFNLFQLLQATARCEGLGVPAKGVTGRGYEGHYFWDTEIYVVPFLAHTTPEWAKQLLQFRCDMLPAARRRAHEVGHGGALYPWRTIDGREASAWYAAGTAQYHINADIAHAMHQYNRVTGDLAFMLDEGAQVLVETARFWLELGHMRDGRLRIHGVTGPDEYTTLVHNNAYTNLMAKQNLEIAVRITEWLAAADPEARAALGVADEEVDSWRRAAELMYVPRHEELGIALQDEHFLDRPRWDFEGTPREKRPLLLHFHPLEIYRHQVIKQTDVVLATYLLPDSFSEEETRRTFDYYDALTTGDSTLSACIQSVIASQVGYAGAALDYFLDACAVDLLDAHGNTADGIHIASCGGTWLALAAGFGGLRDSDGAVAFRPRLPEQWDRLRFRVGVRGQLIEVDMQRDATSYRLLEGHGILLRHEDEQVRLAQGAAVTRPARTDALELRRAA